MNMYSSGSSVDGGKVYHTSLAFSTVGDVYSSPPGLHGAAHPEKPLFSQAVWGCTQNWCSKQALWNKCLILRPVCTILKTNQPLYEGQSIEITKPAENRAPYPLVSTAERSHKNSMNPWKTPSSQSASAAERSHPGSIFPPDVLFPSGFLTLISSTTFLSSGLFLSHALQFLAFKTTACILLKTTTKVMMFETQENTNASQLMSRLPLFFLMSSTMWIN